MALTTVKSDQIQTSVALAGSPTTTTQSASDNSTKVATTAYVETAVANLVASAPAALNTLDELAAALNDDASFSTTVTNSIATKLPLAGGTMTGDLTTSGFVKADNYQFYQNSSASGASDAIYRKTTATLAFKTGSTERMTLDGSGNLTLSGALVGTKASFDTASTTDYALRLTDNGVADYDFTFPDTSTIQLGTNTTSTKHFKLLNAGSGSFNLDVEGSITSGSTIQGVGTGTAAAFQLPWATSAIALRMAYDANYYMSIETHAQTRDLILTSSTNDATANIRFKTSGTGASNLADRMVIDHTGKVGIGTGNIDAKLHIEGNSDNGDADVELVIEDLDSSSGSQIPQIVFKGNGSTIGRIRTNDVQGILMSGGSTMSDDLVVTNSGVGIGTTSIGGLLTIRGTGDAIRVESTNAGAGGAQLDLLHHTASPADNDTPGSINFGGYYSGTTPAYSAAIRSIWTDVSAREGKLAFLTREGGTFGERLTITHEGYVQKSAQPYIRCSGNSASRVTNYGTIVDPFNNWSTVTSRGITRSGGVFTVPVAGEYLITYSFYFWMDNIGHSVSHSVLLKYGSTNIQESILELPNHSGTGSYLYDNTVSNSLIVSMSAGDTFQFRVYADIYGGVPHTNMSAYLLG